MSRAVVAEDWQSHFKRVILSEPGKLPRDPSGAFSLHGQYWDGGLPSQVSSNVLKNKIR